MNTEVQRVYNRDLVGLDEKGRPCEVCHKHMHLHDWADLDDGGFVVNCSFITPAT